jgi:SpoVK/Ycf46/Vps4 family AAA+-type ATPase
MSVLHGGRSVNSPTSLTLFKDGGFSATDVEHIMRGYLLGMISCHDRIAALRSGRQFRTRADSDAPATRGQRKQKEEAVADPTEELKALGIEIYQATDAEGKKTLTWDNMAGYSAVKQELRETILAPLQHPEVYDRIVRLTREHVEPNRPKAVLLEGPPGTVSMI